MKAPPVDLDVESLRNCLGRHWGMVSPELNYLPVGFGDHHWHAQAGGRQYFVTVRDLRLDDRAPDPVAALEQTFQAVNALKQASGLRFLVPPLPATGGATIVPIATHFATSVYVWIDVQPSFDGDSAVAVEIVAELHRASRDHPVDAVRENFRIPHGAALETALLECDTPWTGGPFAEPSRMLLRAHQDEVWLALRLYDQLARVASASTRSWCLTHGEPGGTNLVQDQRGAVVLVDWESARLAPPERDLAPLDLSASDLQRYQELAGGRPVRQDILRLYQLWYALAETAVYLLQFRRPHIDDANLRESWRNFQRFVPTHERWPGLANMIPGQRLDRIRG